MNQDLETAVSNITKALKDKSTLLHSLCDCAPCLMWAKYADGTYAYANAKHRKEFLGIGLTGSLQGVTDAGHPLADMCAASDRVVLTRLQPIRTLESCTVSDGVPMFLQVDKAPWFGSHDQLMGSVGVAVDVTDRILAQQDLVASFEGKIKELGIESEMAEPMSKLKDYTNRHQYFERSENG